jgi:DNA transformation protein and related proteins
MSVTGDYLAYILDQLRAFGHVTARRMFGGVGLYADGFFFGIIDDTVYFKVDDSNRSDYETRDCRQFSVEMEKGGRRIVSMSYFAVPEEVLEDPDELKLWARKALAVAVAAAAVKSRPKVSSKTSPKAQTPRS